MPATIILRIGSMELSGQLNDSATARAVLALLPATLRMSRWGDEYYGALPKPLGVAEAPEARELMVMGELAYWPPGNALCLFFGPTPVSTGSEPRAASPVNPIGMLSGDWAALRRLGKSVELSVAQAGS
jgi:uncharacterized protein